ncbi:hypothetical protein POM88_022034 [Heracleum sosnowskyi]|uniref:Uncharacterized protein n=1 Tax=Heracleum sosnowskyi TaxID=360622 RepID=A0AAD8IG19_9APIA|nr:hypothetical protein POM88_022034 [Heracleum sosnowskyi]
MTYRYNINDDEKTPFTRIGRVFIKAINNWRSTISQQIIDEEAPGTLHHQSFQQFKFLNKALLSPDGSKIEANICSMNDVEEAKAVLRLVPIWASCLVCTAVFSQLRTFFTKQGVTMNRSIGSHFEIPPAAFLFFSTLPIVIIIPIYDRILVPCARAITGKPSALWHNNASKNWSCTVSAVLYLYFARTYVYRRKRTF